MTTTPPLFRTRKQVFLAKTETTSGVDAAPVVGTDSVRVKFPVAYTNSFESIDTAYTTSSLTEADPITGGGHVGADANVYIAARGADDNSLFASAGMSLVFTTVAVAGAVTGGGIGSVILQSGASAVDNAYQGMLIRVYASGGALLRECVITSYSGSSKTANIMPALPSAADTTMTYSIPPGFLYRPVSAGLQTVTNYLYDPATDNSLARLRIMLGAASNFSFTARAGKLVEARFALRGQMQAVPVDVGAPQYSTNIGGVGSVYYSYASPATLINAAVYMNFIPIRFTELTFDLGNGIQMFDDPSAVFGYGPAVITTRKASGKITLDQTAVSVVNNMQSFISTISQNLWVCWGPTGNKSSIFIPQIKFTGNEPGDNQGFVVEGMPFRAGGADSEIFLFFTSV
jgi:hypothetical protein